MGISYQCSLSTYRVQAIECESVTGFSMTLSGQDSMYLLYKFMKSSSPFSVSRWVLASGQLRDDRR